MSAHDKKPIKEYEDVRQDANHCRDPAREEKLKAALEEYKKYNDACKDVETMSDENVWTKNILTHYALPDYEQELESDKVKLDKAHRLYFGVPPMYSAGPAYEKYRIRVSRLERIVRIWKSSFGESKHLKPDKGQRAEMLLAITREREKLLDSLDVKLKELYPSAGQSTSNSLGNARFRPVSRQPNYLYSTSGRY